MECWDQVFGRCIQEVINLVSTISYDSPIKDKEVKKDLMTIGISQSIIAKGFTVPITLNIIDLKNQREIWDELKSIYSNLQ